MTNREPASGGVDGETVENAMERGPISLRTLGRAVTVEDYEILAHGAAPGIARVRCVAAGETEPRQMAYASSSCPPSPTTRTARCPSPASLLLPELLSLVAAELDRRRTIGARVVVEPPLYQGVTVVAQLRARPFADPVRVRDVGDLGAVPLSAPDPRRGGGNRLALRPARALPARCTPCCSR